MKRMSGSPRQRFFALLVAIAASALLIGVSAWLAGIAADHRPSGTPAATWRSALLMIVIIATSLVTAGLAAALGALWMRQRLEAALREARGEGQALAALIEAWHWRSDPEHRLLSFVAPQGSQGADEAAIAPTAGDTLWAGHAAQAEAAPVLRAAFESQRPFDALRVEHRAADGAVHAWTLRGQPRFDAEGRFAGYLGTASLGLQEGAGQPSPTAALAAGAAAFRASRPGGFTEAPQPAARAPASGDGNGPGSGASPSAPATPAQAVGGRGNARDGGAAQPADPGADVVLSPAPAPAPTWLPALAQMLDQLPAAAFAGLGQGADWQLSYANTIALELLGTPVGDPPPLSWPELIDRLPTTVQTAVRGLVATQSSSELQMTETQGWTLGLQSVDATPGVPPVQWLTMAAPAQAAGGHFDPGLSDQEAFSYTVSHDLRAPIRVVEGFTRIVKEDYGRVLDRIGVDHLDRVLGAAARMNNMIDALLDLSRLSTQPLTRQPVNLSQLAGYVLDELRRSAPERHVEVVVQPGMHATGDPTLLRMVIENLLGNAWKYSQRAPQARIEFDQGGTDDRPVYCVRDNGAGFDMRFADRLFGIFQRLHSPSDFAGTGIGLASVRRILRRHGGEIWAEGEVGKGARFFFTLRK